MKFIGLGRIKMLSKRWTYVINCKRDKILCSTYVYKTVKGPRIFSYQSKKTIAIFLKFVEDRVGINETYWRNTNKLNPVNRYLRKFCNLLNGAS